jgi:hypothetical protein
MVVANLGSHKIPDRPNEIRLTGLRRNVFATGVEMGTLSPCGLTERGGQGPLDRPSRRMFPTISIRSESQHVQPEQNMISHLNLVERVPCVPCNNAFSAVKVRSLTAAAPIEWRIGAVA